MTDPKETNSGSNEGGNPPGNKDDNQAGGSGGGDSGGSTHPLPTDEIRTIVQEEIAKALNNGKGGDPKDDKNDNDSGSRSTPRRADIEAMAERMVREQAEKLHHEQEHERLRNSQGTPPKAEQQESAPKKVRRITRALWGSDD